MWTLKGFKFWPGTVTLLVVKGTWVTWAFLLKEGSITFWKKLHTTKDTEVDPWFPCS